MSRRRKNNRARTQRRRAERRIPKAAKHAPEADGLHDDCPMCRAMRAVGAVPNHGGVVTMTPQMQARYQEVLDEIIAEEGWPEEAVRITGEELNRWFDAIQADLTAAGHPTDLDAMTDAELGKHFERVEEASLRLFGRPGAPRRPSMVT